MREYANIIVFLSYHTRNSLIIDNVMRIANSIFADKAAFDLSAAQADVINKLVAESPKVMMALEAKKEREKTLKARDRIERKMPKDNEADEADGNDISVQMRIGFRSMKIIGQLLKNHYAKFDAGPKKGIV